jgi:predicted acetyltransferase
MRVSEALVPQAEKPALAEVMRDYLAEMTTLTGAPSMAAYPFFDLYWTQPDRRWPYWIRAHGSNAGFALVRRNTDDVRFEIAEFFVAPMHRRRGIGLASARKLISRYPGAWQISQREVNANAIAFWHRVLDGFAVYEETTSTTDAVRREQRFTMP